MAVIRDGVLIQVYPEDLINGTFQIPDTVTSIGDNVFKNCMYIESIVIPGTVKHIGTSAFESCKNLKSVVLSEGIVSIKSNAFAYCSGLKNITMPSTVINISVRSFFWCSKLESIIIPNAVTFIGYGALTCTPRLDTIKFGNVEIRGCNGVNASTFVDDKLIILCDGESEFRIIDKNNEEERIDLEIFGDIFTVKQLFRTDLLFKWKELFTTKKGVIDVGTLRKLDDEIILNAPPNRENVNLIKQGLNEYLKIKKHAGFTSNEGNSDLFKMCYSLGLFSGDKERSRYAREYIKAKLNNKKFDIHKIFGNFKLDNGYNDEKTILIIKALSDDYFLVHPDYIAKINNEYEDMKKYIRREYKVLIRRDLISKIKTLISKNQLSEDEKEEIRQLQEEVDKKQKGIEKLSLEEVKYCINNKMFSIREGNEPLGSIVDTLIAIDPQEFDKLQDLYEASKGLKKEIIPTIDSGYGGSYTYEWSASDNPINLALGDIMDCCARLKWVGEDIMVQSMINPLIQNLIIRDEKGDIVAKSTAYYNKEEQYILFNNVEAIYDLNEKEKKNQSFLNKEEIIKTIMRAINDQINALHEQGSEIREVRVGMKNNDLFTESDLKIVKSNLLPNYPYKKYDGDANHPDYGQGILYRSKIKETITTTKSK